jgi:hypothetical protein
MKRYMNIQPIPEIEQWSKRNRKRIWRRGMFRSFRYWETLAAYLGLGACGGMGGGIAVTISDSIIAVVVCCGIGGAIGGFFFGPLLTGIARVCVLEELESLQVQGTN